MLRDQSTNTINCGWPFFQVSMCREQVTMHTIYGGTINNDQSHYPIDSVYGALKSYGFIVSSGITKLACIIYNYYALIIQ